MEQNKYFTPSIEDISINYFCDVKGYGEGYLTYKMIEDIYTSKINFNDIKVPYLTKEQIAIELPNWKQRIGGSYIFESDEFYMPVYLKGHKSFFRRIYFHPNDGPWVNITMKTIGSDEEETLFEGRVKCINSFRNLIYNYLEFEKNGK